MIGSKISWKLLSWWALQAMMCSDDLNVHAKDSKLVGIWQIKYKLVSWERAKSLAHFMLELKPVGHRLELDNNGSWRTEPRQCQMCVGLLGKHKFHIYEGVVILPFEPNFTIIWAKLLLLLFFFSLQTGSLRKNSIFVRSFCVIYETRVWPSNHTCIPAVEEFSVIQRSLLGVLVTREDFALYGLPFPQERWILHSKFQLLT